jgi:hypothetical protein
LLLPIPSPLPRIDLCHRRLRQLVTKLRTVTEAVEVHDAAASSFAAWLHTEALCGQHVLDASSPRSGVWWWRTRGGRRARRHRGGGAPRSPSTVPLRAVFPALRSLVVAYSRRKASAATLRRRGYSAVPPHLRALPCLAPPLHWRKGGSGIAERSRGAWRRRKGGASSAGRHERGGVQ